MGHGVKRGGHELDEPARIWQLARLDVQDDVSRRLQLLVAFECFRVIFRAQVMFGAVDLKHGSQTVP
jgi:hypothetical protein